MGLSDLSPSLPPSLIFALSSREDSGDDKLVRDVESNEGGDGVIM